MEPGRYQRPQQSSPSGRPGLRRLRSPQVYADQTDVCAEEKERFAVNFAGEAVCFPSQKTGDASSIPYRAKDAKRTLVLLGSARASRASDRALAIANLNPELRS